jgi:hypothetical protein
MGLVIPPPVQHLPQAQPQQPVQPKPEVVQLAQARPIATQTQRAVAGASRSRGADGTKSEEKRGLAGGAEKKAAETTGAQPQRKRGGITIDV